MRRASLVELPLIPGAVADDTDLAAKLHAVDMDKVRSRGGRWETIKGWSAFNASGMTAGKARGIHSWATLDGTPVVLAASESAVNAWVEGTRYDVTPKWVDTFLQGGIAWAAGTNPTITLTWNPYDLATDSSGDADHNLKVGDVITLTGVVPDGDALADLNFDLNGTYTITAVPTSQTVQFVATGTASDSNFLSNAPPFVATVAFRAGIVTGTGDAIADRPRIYSVIG